MAKKVITWRIEDQSKQPNWKGARVFNDPDDSAVVAFLVSAVDAFTEGGRASFSIETQVATPIADHSVLGENSSKYCGYVEIYDPISAYKATHCIPAIDDDFIVKTQSPRDPDHLTDACRDAVLEAYKTLTGITTLQSGKTYVDQNR